MQLYSINSIDVSEPPPEKTTEWRESCSSTLIMTVSLIALYFDLIFIIEETT